MNAAPPSKAQLTRAYRHLYRNALRAVQFSSPARYTVRDKLRRAFRAEGSTDYDQHRIENTIEFLQNATKEKGLEHKVLKNLLIVDSEWAAREAKKAR